MIVARYFLLIYVAFLLPVTLFQHLGLLPLSMFFLVVFVYEMTYYFPLHVDNFYTIFNWVHWTEMDYGSHITIGGTPILLGRSYWSSAN
jgi:hypothetical protein